jgi:hypothetical protein
MALAFGCILLAIAILGVISTVPSLIRHGLQRTLPDIEAWPVVLLFAFPGWILALPFVILFEDADGWRTWAILAIGTAIGPCFILGWALIGAHGRIPWGQIKWERDGLALVLSLLISFLTTALYVLLLRRFKRKPLVIPPSTI